MSHPVLWHFPISHFNEKVRWALDYKGIPHVRRALFLDYIPRALWKTGQLSLPILLLDGKGIADSTRIIAELERRHPEPPLHPRAEGERWRALALEDFFDEELGHPLRTVVVGDLWERDPEAAIAFLGVGQSEGRLRPARRLWRLMRPFYKARHRINPATQAAASPKVLAALDRIEAELQPSGYLVGDSFSVADLTAAALFGPLVQPPELQYPLPPSAIPPWLQKYRDSLATHPAFAWVLEMYRRHRGASMEVSA